MCNSFRLIEKPLRNRFKPDKNRGIQEIHTICKLVSIRIIRDIPNNIKPAMIIGNWEKFFSLMHWKTVFIGTFTIIKVNNKITEKKYEIDWENIPKLFDSRFITKRIKKILTKNNVAEGNFFLEFIKFSIPLIDHYIKYWCYNVIVFNFFFISFI